MTSIKLELFFLFTLAAVFSEAEYTCGPCTCHDGDFWYYPGLKIATCWKNDLTTVPDLPADIQVLQISGGSVSKLSDSQFTCYRRLQRITIFNNNIEQIEQGSFRYTTNVTHINLGYNKISELSTDCFTFSPNLITVELHDNIITQLQTHLFNNFKYLKEVNLARNAINTLEEHCFAKVPQLEKIDLSNNKLISLDIKFLDNPSSLKGLYLYDNPWHCDTSLCGLMDTVVSRELWGFDSAPTCTTPQNLTKRQWSKSLLTELCLEPLKPQPSCDAPLIISNTSSVNEGQDLRLTCNYCFPSRLVWTFNDVTLPSNYIEKSEESLTSTLTITNVVRGQQGYYLCKIRSCEDCRNDGVYVSVTGKPQSDIDFKQVVHVPDVNSSESCGSRRGLFLLEYTVVRYDRLYPEIFTIKNDIINMDYPEHTDTATQKQKNDVVTENEDSSVSNKSQNEDKLTTDSPKTTTENTDTITQESEDQGGSINPNPTQSATQKSTTENTDTTTQKQKNIVPTENEDSLMTNNSQNEDKLTTDSPETTTVYKDTITQQSEDQGGLINPNPTQSATQKSTSELTDTTTQKDILTTDTTENTDITTEQSVDYYY